MDMSDFYQTFFAEADELLANMESCLLALDFINPDRETLDAIFRAAHSIKGGAGTFGFTLLQETTHILENLLDDARGGNLQLNSNIINLFLESKDIMQDQLDAYKSSQDPDQESFQYICEALRQIALTSKQQPAIEAGDTSAVDTLAVQQQPVIEAFSEQDGALLQIILRDVKEADLKPLTDELANFGSILEQHSENDTLQVLLQSDDEPDDILAVMCFLLDPQQVTITPRQAPLCATTDDRSDNTTHNSAVADDNSSAKAAGVPPTVRSARAQGGESSSIRVAVEKVDQIINQVGELIITQSMLSQLSNSLDPTYYDTLIASIAQMERNARDLQESVMSIRMMPMEYVFSRFPRLVHDLAGKLNKDVELTLIGGSAELDKSLIERIVDPLTHLVRNSLDHGIEPVDIRRANGKPEKGNLILSAEHHGGNIVIEVTDDGAGLNRERILARAASQGMSVSENMSDEEVWMLIFAPGFSTAEKVTDVSGRGVGMDVVRRNIQTMGGHVEIHSEAGKGSTIRIILPLTLAILDGMSVRVGDEIYVLPLNAVMESLTPSENSLYQMAGGEIMLQVRDEYIPLIEMKQMFNVQGDVLSPAEGICVILQAAGVRFALLVDQLIGQHQVVVKNLELNYRKVVGIAAATILGDGSVAFILDVAALPNLYKEKRQPEHK